MLESQVSKRSRLHDVIYLLKHAKYEQLKHCIVKTKTNHVVVLQTLSTTFHFLGAFWILVIVLFPFLEKIVDLPGG